VPRTAAVERFKGLAESHELPGSLDDEAEMRLQLMLLRAAEGSTSPAAEPGDRDRPGAHALDPRCRSRAGRRRRSVLADCLVIRESLDQACVEIQRAISSVRDRLDGIADRIDGSTSVAGVGSNGGDSR
jgi:hypothetical protein